LAIELPQRDVRALAERLAKTGPIPEVVYETPPVYTLGESSRLWVGNVDTMEHFSVTAVLRAVTPHLYVWVEDGLRYDQEALVRSAENFEKNIYPTNREFFGSEWSPGVDNDLHLHILHSSGEHMGASVAGYYSSADEVAQLANPYSNEREMFYISLSGASPGSDFYDGVLAHEFQHMIHWANDRNEETWVNEGCSELAAYLNNYDPGGFEWLFLADPDVQLTTWAEFGDAAAHYGNSYLFMAYFLGRFGEETMQRVVAHPANGIVGFDQVLLSYDLRFEDVFADWLIANYADNVAGSTQKQYHYPDHVVGPVSVDISHDRYPVQRSSTVHQYAADYIELKGEGDVAISFSGDTQARLVPANAHSGQMMWWANRGDDSDTALTRAFDLRSLEHATLQVWMWYDIEKSWDYGYVVLSTDGGRTWDVLTGSSSTASDPNGNSFGPAYTGESGGWIQEGFDLSPYVGQEVLLRFEYVTDDAINHPGWLIDDISIPELNYLYDGESGTDGWESSGFIYSDNLVSQHYLVRLITFGQQMDVRVIDLDETQSGSVELRGLGDAIDSAVLVVSALAPVTTEVASYEYTIELLD
ncbi:MAG: immune inhibitor A, partial [Anaerolineae bacterium]|nr:immune inhibitor A [Anaerolineae bacterium]